MISVVCLKGSEQLHYKSGCDSDGIVPVQSVSNPFSYASGCGHRSEQITIVREDPGLDTNIQYTDIMSINLYEIVMRSMVLARVVVGWWRELPALNKA